MSAVTTELITVLDVIEFTSDCNVPNDVLRPEITDCSDVVVDTLTFRPAASASCDRLNCVAQDVAAALMEETVDASPLAFVMLTITVPMSGCKLIALAILPRVSNALMVLRPIMPATDASTSVRLASVDSWVPLLRDVNALPNDVSAPVSVVASVLNEDDSDEISRIRVDVASLIADDNDPEKDTWVDTNPTMLLDRDTI